MIHFYLLPVEIASNGWRGPKYIRWRYDPDPPGLLYRARVNPAYGHEPLYLMAIDFTAENDAILSSKSDVFRFPDNLDLSLGANRQRITEELERFNIPAHWLQAAHTYRDVIRGIHNLFDVVQCLLGKGHRVFAHGLTLDHRLNQAPEEFQKAFLDSVIAQGHELVGLTVASPLRDILGQISQRARHRAMLGVWI